MCIPHSCSRANVVELCQISGTWIKCLQPTSESAGERASVTAAQTSESAGERASVLFSTQVIFYVLFYFHMDTFSVDVQLVSLHKSMLVSAYSFNFISLETHVFVQTSMLFIQLSIIIHAVHAAIHYYTCCLPSPRYQHPRLNSHHFLKSAVFWNSSDHCSCANQLRLQLCKPAATTAALTEVVQTEVAQTSDLCDKHLTCVRNI